MIFEKYNFSSRGIGIISTQKISNNFFIGDYFTKSHPVTTQSRFIYDGWIETNPLGRFLNHNRNPNCTLKLCKNVIEIYTNREIGEFEELTINYLDVINLISLPKSLIERYSIIDYDYVDEVINKKTSIL